MKIGLKLEPEAVLSIRNCIIANKTQTNLFIDTKSQAIDGVSDYLCVEIYQEKES